LGKLSAFLFRHASSQQACSLVKYAIFIFLWINQSGTGRLGTKLGMLGTKLGMLGTKTGMLGTFTIFILLFLLLFLCIFVT